MTRHRGDEYFHHTHGVARRPRRRRDASTASGGAASHGSGLQHAFLLLRAPSAHAQRRAFSSPSSARAPAASFKKVLRPFLVACHPDAAPADADAEAGARKHPLSGRARAVNLAAVQTINGLIDVLEELLGRCTPPSRGGRARTGALPELNGRYEVEFILPAAAAGPAKRKHRGREELTLRSVTVAFPEALRSDVKRWALTAFPPAFPGRTPHPQEEDAWRVTTRLREHALGELLRLLTIAGMQAPASSVRDARAPPQAPPPRPEPAPWTLSDHFLQDLGIDPADAAVVADPTPAAPRGQPLAFFGRTQARPSRERPAPAQAAPATYAHPHLRDQRQRFVESVPWRRFADDYDRAFRDAQADFATTRLDLYDGSTLEGRERRETFVSRICGGVRIWRAPTNEAELEDDIPQGLDVVAQLVAIRRLSLVLYDQFEYLKLEAMGRMWENLVIVLTPPRDRGGPRGKGGGDGAAFSRQGKRKKMNKWERSLKKREKRHPVARGRMRRAAEDLRRPPEAPEADADAGEDRHRLPASGFKFSYGTHDDQGAGQVTAHVPVDFAEDELVRQLYTHVHDYFDTCCGRAGFLRYGADGEVHAAAAGMEGGGGEGGHGGGEDDGGERRQENGTGAEEDSASNAKEGITCR